MEEEKQRKKLMVFAILALMVTVIGVSYAYFQSKVKGGVDTNIDAATGTTDVLTFSIIDKNATDNDNNTIDENELDEILINANNTNFSEGGKNIADGVKATINLIANNANYQATGKYNIYLEIASNELEYSSYKKEGQEDPVVFKTKEEKLKDTKISEYEAIPELYLTVKGPEEKEQEIDGLKKVSLKEPNDSYDITEEKTRIIIAKDVEIKTTGKENSKATDEWEITVTLKNLPTDQNLNTGKQLSGKVVIEKETPEIIVTETCQENETIENCLKRIDNEQHPGNPTFLHHTVDLEGSAEDDSYRYSGGNYWIANAYKETYTQIDDEIIKFSCNGEDKKMDSQYGVWYCYGEGEKYFYVINNQEEHFDVSDRETYKTSSSYQQAFTSAIEKGYIKLFVNNYVCLDGTSENGKCASEADLYRIIGLFKNDGNQYEIKLIKATEGTPTELGDNETAEGGAYHGSNNDYYWNYPESGTYNNMWQYSNLNKVNLNDFYYKYITEKVSGLSEHITEHKWTTGGFPYSITYNAQQVYNKELGTEKLTTSDNKCYSEDNKSTAQTCTEEDLTYTAKIGLMYVSDYGYAAYPDAWSKKLPGNTKTDYDSDIVKENNWMFLGKYEWTVSRYSGNGIGVWSVYYTGDASDRGVYGTGFVVRPVFYLESSTKIKSGNGSKTNPFRLLLN